MISRSSRRLFSTSSTSEASTLQSSSGAHSPTFGNWARSRITSPGASLPRRSLVSSSTRSYTAEMERKGFKSSPTRRWSNISAETSSVWRTSSVKSHKQAKTSKPSPASSSPSNSPHPMALLPPASENQSQTTDTGATAARTSTNTSSS